MYEEIAQAKARIQALRRMVNTVWEQWLSTVSGNDPEFVSLDDAFDSALDKITDTYENLIDLLEAGEDSKDKRGQLAESIVQKVGQEAATVLQRVASWYSKRVSRDIGKWQFRLFLPTEDIFEAHERLQKDFKDAAQLHEDNKFTEAAGRYSAVINDAIQLGSRMRRRRSLHPQRRIFFIGVGISILLFLISIGLTLYFNVFRR